MIFKFSHTKGYGKDRLYPLCSNSKLLLKLMRRNSLTKEQLVECKQAGWNIEIEIEKFEL